MLYRFFIAVFFLLVSVFTSGQVTITGILYSDHKPVSISFNQGRITGIKRIKKLPADSKDLYIAPGLIDNQVNGFAGISFTFGGGELTAEGVKKATMEL